MSDSPFFSIIIPSYNRADWLPKTIQSVLQQSEKDFEILVIDDGSTDHTKEVIDGFDDPRVKYHHQHNAERGAARNKGVQLAQGRYVHFLDSDDMFFDGHLEEARKQLSTETVSFYFQPYCLMRADGSQRKEIPEIWKDANLMLVKYGNFMSCHGIFLDRQFALDNPFQEDRNLAGSEDYELWLRMAARTRFKMGIKVTSALIEHADRSVLNFNTQQLIRRKETFLRYLQLDSVLMRKYGQYLPLLRANAYFYIAVHFPMHLQGRKLRLQFWWKAILSRPASGFTKRSIVVLKQAVLGR